MKLLISVLLSVFIYCSGAFGATASSSFTATGGGNTLRVNDHDRFTYSVSGTFVGRVELQESTDGGQTYKALKEFSAAASGTYQTATSNGQPALYRFNCRAFTSGTIVTSITDDAVVLHTFGDKDGNPILVVTDLGIEVNGAVDADSLAGGAAGFDPSDITDPLETPDAAGNTNALSIKTGDSSGSNSGAINLQTGTAGGTRGNVTAYGGNLLFAADGYSNWEGPTRINLSTDGNIEIYPWSNIRPGLKLFEATGTYGTVFKAHASLGADYNFILPDTDGAADNIMITDGAGNWSYNYAKVSGTPIWSGANQGNIAFSSYVYHRGVGADAGYMLVDHVRVEVSGTLGVGAALTWTLPGGLLIDTADNPRGTDVTNAGRAYYGNCRWFQAGTGWKAVGAYYKDADEIQFVEAPGFILDSQLTFSGQNSSLQCNDLKIPITTF